MADGSFSCDLFRFLGEFARGAVCCKCWCWLMVMPAYYRNSLTPPPASCSKWRLDSTCRLGMQRYQNSHRQLQRPICSWALGVLFVLTFVVPARAAVSILRLCVYTLTGTLNHSNQILYASIWITKSRHFLSSTFIRFAPGNAQRH